MTKLSYRVSYYVLYACIALLFVVFGIFYAVGYHNIVGEYNVPEHTETLIYFMYAMLAVCVVATLLGAFAQFLAALRDNPKGAIKSLVGIVLFGAVLLVAYNMGSTEPIMTGDGLFTDAVDLKVTDMMIYAIYFLLMVASAGTLVNLSGIFKR